MRRLWALLWNAVGVRSVAMRSNYPILQIESGNAGTKPLCMVDAVPSELPEMTHPIYRVRSFEIVSPYTLRVKFDDDVERVINFECVLAGELFGPLRDLAVFHQVRIDPKVQTLVWPNGADFDPATLHDWARHAPELEARAKQWDLSPT